MTKTFTRRNRLEVAYEILSFCLIRRRKTHILYKCNLSYDQLQKYIEFLVAHALLESLEENGNEFYQATEHGGKFVSEYQRLSQIVNEAERNR